MAPDHLGLTGTQTSTPGGGVRENPCDTSSLMRFLAQQRSSQAQQRLAHALKVKQNSSSSRCGRAANTGAFSPRSGDRPSRCSQPASQPAGHLTHLAQVAGDT